MVGEAGTGRRCQEIGHRVGGQRRGEAVPLPLVAADRPGVRQLRVGFDPLGRHPHPQVVGKRRHGPGHGQAPAITGKSRHEGPGDLEGAEGETLQGVERRGTRAEIVEGQSYPERREQRECVRDRVDVLEGVVFGDFQPQPFGRQSCLFQGRGDLANQVTSVDLPCRRIDVDPDRSGFGAHSRPRLQLPTRLPQDPLPNGRGDPRILGQRQELVREQETVAGMIPAHERFDGNDPAGAQVDDRLKVQTQLVPLDGPAQSGLQVQLPQGVDVHAGVEDHGGGLAGGLGPVHRRVRVAQQIAGVDRDITGEGHPDAGSGEHFVAIDGDGLPQDGKQTLRELVGILRVDPFKHHDEFVAGEPADGIAGPQACRQPLRHGDEDPITGVVTQPVVDDLEAVQVQEQDGDAAAAPLRLRQGMGEPVHHQDAVGEVGQWVVEGAPRQLRFDRLALGQIQGGRDEPRHAAVGVAERHHAEGDGNGRAGTPRRQDLAFPGPPVSHPDEDRRGEVRLGRSEQEVADPAADGRQRRPAEEGRRGTVPARHGAGGVGGDQRHHRSVEQIGALAVAL